MSQKFSVSIESPQSGFMSLRLRSGADEELVLGVACAPYDSLRDLIGGLSKLLDDGGRGEEIEVRWNCEPEEYDFRFAPRGVDEVELTVTRFQDHRRRKGESGEVFAHVGHGEDICAAFWKELRELRRRSEVDVFESNWRRAFPEDEMRELTRLVRARRRSARRET